MSDLPDPFDTDGQRLPEDLSCMGYSPRTQVYRYQSASDGRIWENSQGDKCGRLRRVEHDPAPVLAQALSPAPTVAPALAHSTSDMSFSDESLALCSAGDYQGYICDDDDEDRLPNYEDHLDDNADGVEICVAEIKDLRGQKAKTAHFDMRPEKQTRNDKNTCQCGPRAREPTRLARFFRPLMKKKNKSQPETAPEVVQSDTEPVKLPDPATNRDDTSGFRLRAATTFPDIFDKVAPESRCSKCGLLSPTSGRRTVSAANTTSTV